MITTDASFLARLVSNSSAVRDQLAQVQQQVATGYVSDTYSGLGNQARTALDLTPEIAHQTSWSKNIDTATGRLDVTQSAMTSISAIASSFYAKTAGFNANDSSSTQVLAQDARNALQQVGDLLNSKSGDVYVFAGTDTNHAPIPNTDPTTMATALLSGGSSTAPFSSTLGTTAPTIETGKGQSAQIGLLANANTLATSASPTSGSYMRDLMTALAKIAGLSTSGTAASDNSAARLSLGSAISAMSAETGALGNVQSNLTTRQTQLSALSTSLTKQLSNAQDVDAASAITKASVLQTQLQASYQIIAQTRNLSLANYL